MELQTLKLSQIIQSIKTFHYIEESQVQKIESTFDAYLEECRDMGSDELNDIYDKYYQDYLENTK